MKKEAFDRACEIQKELQIIERIRVQINHEPGPFGLNNLGEDTAKSIRLILIESTLNAFNDQIHDYEVKLLNEFEIL